MLLENGNVIVQFVFQKKILFLIYLPLFMIVARVFFFLRLKKFSYFY